ncbi:type VII secretion protein EccB [Thermocrispum sp.]|uniref:type VII secretion protein EccB n=1 Tax=Thermocrispum sp. TaxID=2060768 RepID=UPI00257BD147|nr:type VII secretion protein EccB [Thermocrispum sp.]
MQSKKDQVQAYFYVVGRLVAAVVHGKPDVLVQPNRRLNTGTMFGVIIGLIIAGICGVVGLFLPGGNNSWRMPGAIVMNEDTGARYVFLNGELRPVLNYSSARLASGGNGAIHEVSQASLDGTPVGQPIGIPGAPDALPKAEDLSTGPWVVCAQPPQDGAEQPRPSTTLFIGRSIPANQPDDRALLVRAPDKTIYLVWHGKRYRLPSRTEVAALGYGQVEPVEVDTAWLNPIPQGPDIEAERPPGLGTPGPEIDGNPSLVGQLYRMKNPALDSEQLYLVLSDGVLPLTRTAAALYLAAPFTKEVYDAGAVAPIDVGPAAMNGVPTSGSGPEFVDGLPDRPPPLANPQPNETACLEYTMIGGGRVKIRPGLLPVDVHRQAMPASVHYAGKTADRVAVPAGGGVLAVHQSTPESVLNTIYLITETGVRYPLVTADVAAALGYSAETAMRMPGELLDLLPVGPALSQQAALTVQPQQTS